MLNLSLEELQKLGVLEAMKACLEILSIDY